MKKQSTEQSAFYTTTRAKKEGTLSVYTYAHMLVYI